MPSPVWSSSNLIRHRNKHGQCFEDLLHIENRVITESEYAGRVQLAIEQAWLEYEAESHDSRWGGYREAAATYVDDDLVLAVTDLSRSSLITSFHEHFDRPNRCKTIQAMTSGDRRLKYKQYFRWDEQGGKIRNVKVIHGI